MDQELPSEGESIKESPKGRREPLWKKILSTVLFLIGVPWTTVLLVEGLCNIQSYQGTGYFWTSLIKQGGTHLIGAFCVFAVFIWGGTFLWSRWRRALGVICLIWGAVQFYWGISAYIRGELNPLWEKAQLKIGFVLLIFGIGFVGVELFRVFQKQREEKKGKLSTKGFLAGLIVGIILGVLVSSPYTIGLINTLLHYSEFKRETILFKAPKQYVEQELSGAHVLDIEVSSPSKAEVNYKYDKLYDVNITYERGGKVKRMVLPYGFYKGVTICPTVTELVIKDDQAEVIYNKAHPDSAK